MDTEIGNIKTILLAEDDSRDVELNHAALVQSNCRQIIGLDAAEKASCFIAPCLP